MYTRSVNGDRYNHDQSSAYGAGHRVYDPAWALSKDPEADEKILRDAHVAGLVRRRKHKVAPLKWRFECEDDGDPRAKRYAKVLTDAVRRIDDFAEARFNLADAEVKGRSYAFIRGQFQADTLGDGVPRMWWVPRQLVDMDRRRFRRVVTNRRPLRTAWELWDVEERKWRRIVAPQCFVKHVYDDDESNLGYGRGLIDSLYVYWRAKTVVLEEGLAGVERWARGMLVAKVDNLREASSGKTNDAIAQQFLDVLDRTRGRHVTVFDKSDEVDVVTGGLEGAQIVDQFLRYLDDRMEELVLGRQHLSSDSGSLARAESEGEDADDSLEFSRVRLDEAIQRDVVGLFIETNHDVLDAMGFRGCEVPRFTTAAVRRIGADKAATIASTLLSAGVSLVAADVYEQVGFKRPMPGDEVIEPRPAPAPIPFGFGGSPVSPNAEPGVAPGGGATSKPAAEPVPTPTPEAE